MDRIRILVVAPYAGLKELILSMADRYPQFSFDVVEANLEEAIPKLKQIDLDRYFAILSRGGTAKLIARSFDQFVVGLEISGYDILRLVMLAKNYPGKAVIMGFDSITRRCKMMCELLDVKIEICTIDNAEQAAAMVDTLDKNSNILVLGDVISTQIAGRKGFPNFLISSGEESVQYALEEIERQTRFIQSCRQRNSLYRMVQLNAPAGAFLFDEEGRLLPESNDAPVLSAALAKYVDQVSQDRGQTAFLLKLEGGEHYHVTGKLLKDLDLLGDKAVIVFYVQKLDNKPGNSPVTLLSTEEIDKSDFNVFSADHEQLKQTMELARKLAPTEETILIEGETGTGKSLLAQMIHSESCHRDGLFVQISCGALEQGGLKNILDQTLFGILQTRQVTLYFSDFHRLKAPEQQELARRLPQLKKHRLIVSSERNLYEMVHRGQMDGLLLSMLEFTQIWIPPLRMLKGSIQEYFYLLLAKMNLRYGKQIVGIERSALELMESYGWAGNLEQFRDVVANAVQKESTSYIRKSTVASLLSVYNQAQWARKRYSGQTLQEIEQDIVIATLQEMNMNQSHAAKRLGISRTTLWRILKNTPNQTDNENSE